MDKKNLSDKFLILGFSFSKTRFSSSILPNKDVESLKVAILNFHIISIPSSKASFTFPSYKDNFYIKTLNFVDLPDETLMLFRYGNKSYSISVSSFPLHSKYYSSTIKVDFIDIYGVPLEVEKGETIIIELTLPDWFVSQIEPNSFKTAKCYMEYY